VYDSPPTPRCIPLLDAGGASRVRTAGMTRRYGAGAAQAASASLARRSSRRRGLRDARRVGGAARLAVVRRAVHTRNAPSARGGGGVAEKATQPRLPDEVEETVSPELDGRVELALPRAPRQRLDARAHEQPFSELQTHSRGGASRRPSRGARKMPSLHSISNTIRGRTHSRRPRAGRLCGQRTVVSSRRTCSRTLRPG